MTRLLAVTALFIGTTAQHGLGEPPPEPAEVSPPPRVADRVENRAGLMAPGNAVSLGLPLPPRIRAEVWLALAAHVGLDAYGPEFAAHVTARAEHLQLECAARRRRAAQHRYDEVNIALAAGTQALNEAPTRAVAYGLLAWATQEARQSAEQEARVWAATIEEAALSTAQAGALDPARIAQARSQLVRERCWSVIALGPAATPGFFFDDLESSLDGARLLTHDTRPALEPALHEYRQRCMDALVGCMKSYEAYYRAAASDADASRAGYAQRLADLFTLQVGSIDTLAAAIGPSSDAWRTATLSRMLGPTALLVHVHCEVARLSRTGLTDAEVRVLDELEAATRGAVAGSRDATRDALVSLALGHQGGARDHAEDFRASMHAVLHELQYAIGRAVAALWNSAPAAPQPEQRHAMRNSIARSLAQLGHIDEHGAWTPVQANPFWPGTILASEPLVRPAMK